MANEKRLYANFVGGTLSASMDTSTTTVQSNALAALPVVDTTNHILITINPDGSGSAEPEIVKVTAHSSGAVDATVVRAQEGTTAQSHPSTTEWHMGLVRSDVENFGLIAIKTYESGADAALSAVTSTSFADVDATNAAITFTVPPSGKVLVNMSAMAGNSTAAIYCRWNLREGAADVTGSDQRVVYGNIFLRPIYKHVITGLTPGTSKTYKWGNATETGGTSNVYSGPAYGPITMEVWALNI